MAGEISMEFDQQADSVYLVINDKPVKISREVTKDIVVDFDKDNKIVGIDIQHLSHVVQEQKGRTKSATGIKVGLVYA